MPPEYANERLFDFDDLEATRAVVHHFWASANENGPARPGERHLVAAGSHEVPVVLHRPAVTTGTVPLLFWIHGGGHVVGIADYEADHAAELADALGCAVAVVEYRLSPAGAYPGSLEDCRQALTWLVDGAVELGIDPGRLVIAGSSSGGGVAAALVLLLRDRGGPQPLLQVLLQPMLDDRTPADVQHPANDAGIWTSSMNARAWATYLGDQTGPTPAYAAPARAEDLSGLPPAYLEIGTHDLFHDETVEYARRLRAAGIPTQLEVWPGAFHAFENYVPDAGITRRARATRLQALRATLGEH